MNYAREEVFWLPKSPYQKVDGEKRKDGFRVAGLYWPETAALPPTAATFGNRPEVRSRPWLRKNAEAKKAVRILFLSPGNLTHKQLRNFSILFAVFLLKNGFHS
jgi:hypothetical protein